ncbi:MAG: hypothetical protein V4486_01395 [Patescibacteria group bacterium]
MRKIRVLLALGVWVALLPYLGFPYFWKNILLSLSGIAVIYVAFVLYKEHKMKEGKKQFDNFSENRDFGGAVSDSA